MKKKITIVLLFCFITFLIVAKDTYDVRKANWGMTIEEVVKSEYPLTPKYNDNEVEFNKVDIGEGYTAKLLYSFTNGRLTEMKYIVYGSQYSRGTCKKIIPLVDKVKFSTNIMYVLKSKGYSCQLGWYLSDKQITLSKVTGKKEDWTNCVTDEKTISLINYIAKKEGGTWVSIIFANKRSQAKFTYNEHQNYQLKYNVPSNSQLSCDDDYYNIRIWLEVTPDSVIKSQMNSNRF
jgi:hypothetical protein